MACGAAGPNLMCMTQHRLSAAVAGLWRRRAQARQHRLSAAVAGLWRRRAQAKQYRLRPTHEDLLLAVVTVVLLEINLVVSHELGAERPTLSTFLMGAL